MSDQVPPPPGGLPPPPPPGFSTPPPGYATYSPGPAPEGATTGYAGFGSRLVAFIIDGVIVGLFSIPAWVALVAGPTHITDCSIDSSGDITGFSDNANGLCEVPTGSTIAIAVILGLVAVIGAFVYYAKLEGGPTGQTVGKRVVRIKVVDATTGGPIGGGRAIGRRLFAGFISGSLCCLGYLWMLWGDRSQTWHDKAVRSVVVKG